MTPKGNVIFIMSTGRCSTQYLARLLALGDSNTIVMHEGAGPNFQPARVFRQNNYSEIIETSHQVKNLLAQIDAHIAAGKNVIDTGWPAYAWGPYFKQRYGDQFGFVHLVRNPFAIAASMGTHSLLKDHDDMLSRHGIIRPDNANALFAGFRSDYAEFSLFERGLYHWLEVNTYLLEQSSGKGFMGIFRFEDLHSNDPQFGRALWQRCGFDPETYQKMPPFDRFNVRNQNRISIKNEKLLDAVWDLSLAMGYSQDLLKSWSDVSFLTQYYGGKRKISGGFQPVTPPV